ncbi:MAG: TRAP transporter small permease [candidate division NC10 bacterium]|nr:TRAP transporter small permease [candidate division NC10 bacterium]
MGRLFRWLMALVETWVMLLLIAMTLLVTVAVFYRYVLGASLIWYDEFASYLLVWLTFYGAVMAAYHRRHIAFETLVERLRPAARRGADLAAEVCVLLFQGILLYYGWVLARAIRADTAVSLEWVRMSWIYSVLPISGALMLLISLVDLATLLTGGARSGKPQALDATE